jgi:type IV secretion system protein VirD4
LTVAGSRSGKSVSIIGNLLFYKGSVLATDPKGELANITALRRQELGQEVYVLDPFKTASQKIF